MAGGAHHGNGEEVSVAGVEPMLVDNENTYPSATTSTAGVKPPAELSRGGSEEPEQDQDPSQRWRALEKLVSRPSPFGAETGQLAVGEFEPFENVRKSARKVEVPLRRTFLALSSPPRSATCISIYIFSQSYCL